MDTLLGRFCAKDVRLASKIGARQNGKSI